MGEGHAVDSLRSDRFWADLLDRVTSRASTSPERLEAYSKAISSGQVAELVERIRRFEYRPSPPVQSEINKGGGRRKTVYTLSAIDDLIFKGVNRHLESVVESELSPLCHSYRPGWGIRTAFSALLSSGGIDENSSLRLDVADYFHSIDVRVLLSNLPGCVRGDAPLMHLLNRFLLDTAVIRSGQRVDVDQKGVMPGTPLSPLLANLYLRDLDLRYEQSGVTYARYGDDIIVLAPTATIHEHDTLIRRHLASRGLRVNESKSRVAGPGEPWEFLGLSYSQGSIDISSHSVRKVKRTVRRLARQEVRTHGYGTTAAQHLLVRLNQKLFGLAKTGRDLNWTAWYFPMLSTNASLEGIDRFIQSTARFAATGSWGGRSHRAFPYALMRDCGYIPLRAAFHAYRDGRATFERFVTMRAGRDDLPALVEA